MAAARPARALTDSRRGRQRVRPSIEVLLARIHAHRYLCVTKGRFVTSMHSTVGASGYLGTTNNVGGGALVPQLVLALSYSWYFLSDKMKNKREGSGRYAGWHVSSVSVLFKTIGAKKTGVEF